jgi:hypothetical protein
MKRRVFIACGLPFGGEAPIPIRTRAARAW